MPALPTNNMIKLIANYSKRLGLPGYSSHQFSVSVEAELNNTDDIQAEASRLYATLQESVDGEIQNTGFIPGDGYGVDTPSPRVSTKQSDSPINGTSPVWRCSDKQKALIGKLITDHKLEREDVERLSLDLFGTAQLHTLHKMQASGLIDRLIEEHGGKSKRGTAPANWRGK